MNRLIENGIINKVDCGNNLAYVVNDYTIFSATEYKVLQSQSDGVFIKCMKLLYNGKVQLYYLTNHFKPLTDILCTIEPNSFMNVVSNILADIISVKSNGFLLCEGIDISLEHIYIDLATYKIGLIYFPLSKRLYPDLSEFESEFRTSLIKLIQNLQSISSPKTMQLAMDLSNGKLSLEDIYTRNKSYVVTDIKEPYRHISVTPQRKKRVKLIATNASMPFEIEVTKDEFTIGKKQELVDRAIVFNKLISRSHCKIIRDGEQFVIVDLDSANGTYVNGPRIQAGQPCPIKNGDLIRLANSEFKVNIE